MNVSRLLMLVSSVGLFLTTSLWPLPASIAEEIASFSGQHACMDHEEDETQEMRALAQQPVQWKSPHAGRGPEVHIQLLAINDFHGQLSAGRFVANRPVGSAAVLAAYLKAAQAGSKDQTFIVHAGDHVGATPPSSALLQDEPALSFLNLLANNHYSFAHRMNPKCNLVGTVGNHEFDEGKNELLRLIEGGNHPDGPFLESPYRGAKFPYVSANVVDARTGEPFLPPYVIKKVQGIRIAFIGAVLKETPTIVTPTGVAGLTFLDEAEAMNRYVQELKAQQVRTIIVLLHQGGRQATYQGPTQPNGAVVDGNINDIVSRLDDEIDVVVSGHAHSFTNALLNNRNGKSILVTQAFSSGTAYADIDLVVSHNTKDVVAKSAVIVTTFADEGPGLTPVAEVARLTTAAEEAVAPLVNQVIGNAATDMTRVESSAGESALGNLIADAQRVAMGTDFAFMNPGGIRADLFAGEVTWGELFTVQPFGNSLVKMTLTGQQIYILLNQQWLNQAFPRMLKTSGLTYTWDNSRPVGDRIVEVRKDGVPITLATNYTVTVNNFLAAGGDNFTVLPQGSNHVGGPIDLDALIEYIESLPQPFAAAIEGRILRLN